MPGQVSNPTDREILLQVRWQLTEILKQLAIAFQQIEKQNTRFEHLALKEQEFSLGITSLRTDFSRAILLAESAQRVSSEGHQRISELRRDLDEHLQDVKDLLEDYKQVKKDLGETRLGLSRWQNYLKVGAVILTPIQVILLAIAVQFFTRLVFGP